MAGPNFPQRGARTRPGWSRAASIALALAAALPVPLGPCRAGNATTILSPDGALGFSGLPGVGGYPRSSDCTDVDVVAPARSRPTLGFGCGSLAPPPPPHEWKRSAGETSWSVGFADGDAYEGRRVRALFGWDHALSVGLLGAWQLHGELALARPTAEVSYFPVLEASRLRLSRDLPGGWNLQLRAFGIAEGAFDPGAAVEQQSEYAVELSRKFRLAAFAPAHQLSLRLAEDNVVIPACGSAQQTMLVRLGYSHALDLGSLGATLSWSRTAAEGVAEPDATRAEIKYALAF
jgi:hypothetical protein